ncbi:MAG: hypothetical protein WD468_05190 [Pirellulales bacterium]
MRDCAHLEASGVEITYTTIRPMWFAEFAQRHGLVLRRPRTIHAADDGSRIDDGDLRTIFGLESVEELTVYHPNVCDDNLRQLSGRANLLSLMIEGGNVSSEGYHEIGRITSLRTLHVAKVHVTSEIGHEISCLSDLEELALLECRLDAGSLDVLLAGTTRLRVLLLQFCSLEGHDIDAIRDCGSLRGLNLAESDLGEDALARLSGLTQLKAMELRGTGVDAALAAQLRSVLPDCQIIADGRKRGRS